MIYFDTSALIKLFVNEAGSRLVARLVTEDGAVATAKIAYTEVHAGLVRKHRAGEISAAEYARTSREFEAEWPAYVRLDLQDDLLVLARDLVRRHPLRGFDAIHLASALSLQSAVEDDLRFVAADGRLLRAASAERLTALDVEAPAAG